MTTRASESEAPATVSSIKDELTRVEAEEPQSSAASRRALVRLEDARSRLARERYGPDASGRLRQPWRVANLYENGCLLTLVLRQASSILEQGTRLVDWAEPWGWRYLHEFRAELVRLAAQQPRLATWMRTPTRAAAEGRARKRFDELMVEVDSAVAGTLVANTDMEFRPEPALVREAKRTRILWRSGLAVGLIGAGVLFFSVVSDDADERAQGPSFLGAGQQANAPTGDRAAKERREARAERREARAERREQAELAEQAARREQRREERRAAAQEQPQQPDPQPEPATEPPAAEPAPAEPAPVEPTPVAAPAAQPAPAPAPPAPAPAPAPAPSSGGGSSDCFSFEC